MAHDTRIKIPFGSCYDTEGKRYFVPTISANLSGGIMYIILSISKSRLFRETMKRLANALSPEGVHLDEITGPDTLVGYFPENVPALIVVDGGSLKESWLEVLIPHLKLHYPDSALLFTCAGQEKMSASFAGAALFPAQTYAELEERLAHYFRQRKESLPSVPKEAFFPLSQSCSFLERLSDPQQAFSLRRAMPSPFPQYQFYTCILAGTGSGSLFLEAYNRALQDTRNCAGFLLNARTALLIFYDRTDNIRKFMQSREQLLHALQFHRPSENLLRIYIGCIHSDCLGLYKSYFEARETQYVDRLYVPCFCFEDISSLNRSSAKPARLMELERLIRSNMEYQGGNDLLYYLKLWFDACRDMHYTLESLQMEALNLYSTIKYVIFDMYTLNTTRLKRGWEVYELFRISSIDELEEWFYTWVTYTLNNVSGKHAERGMKIRDVLDFIENHLLENLSLETVSNYLFLSPSYFSALFKQEMNETFISYVTRRKMQKAAELLRGGRSISETAALLGYGDLKHFRSLFKKQFHQTPSEYQKQWSTGAGDCG